MNKDLITSKSKRQNEIILKKLKAQPNLKVLGLSSAEDVYYETLRSLAMAYRSISSCFIVFPIIDNCLSIFFWDVS